MGVLTTILSPFMGTSQPVPSRCVPAEAPLVVFVHGLASGADAWDQMISLCASDADFDGVAIDQFTYPTALFRIPLLPILPKIESISQGLRTFLKNHHSDRRRIVIVCHSLGGIVARHMIVEMIKADEDVSKFSLVLFACPNNGSSLAQVARRFSIGHKHLGQLAKNANVLKELNSKWCELEVASRLTMRFVAGGTDGIVSPDDARAYCPMNCGETIIKENHSSIIRPVNSGATAYLIVKRAALEAPLAIGLSASRAANPLFEVYYAANEPYYVVRGLDGFLEDENAARHVWLYGGSGFGKTAALRRRLIRSQGIVHQVMLAAYGATPLDLFKRVCDSMAERLGEAATTAVSRHDLLHTFCRIARRLAGSEMLLLQIEEIPVSAEPEQCEFLELVYLAGQALELEERPHTRIFVSSIWDPRADFSGTRDKLEEKLLFLEVRPWRPQDLRRLIEVLSNALSLPLPPTQRAALIRAATGSPRFVKRFFQIWRLKLAELPSFDTLVGLTTGAEAIGG